MLYIGLGMQNGPTEHHRPIYMSPAGGIVYKRIDL
jgi:hypothetical protein